MHVYNILTVGRKLSHNNNNNRNKIADAGEAADEAEDDDEFVFEFCDEYSEVFSAGSSDEVETNTLVADPDFSSCGMGWLDIDDSCHRSIQIELQRAKCRRDEAYVKLLRTPCTAAPRKP